MKPTSSAPGATHNHTRADSALLPCDICFACQLAVDSRRALVARTLRYRNALQQIQRNKTDAYFIGNVTEDALEEPSE